MEILFDVLPGQKINTERLTKQLSDALPEDSELEVGVGWDENLNPYVIKILVSDQTNQDTVFAVINNHLQLTSKTDHEEMEERKAEEEKPPMTYPELVTRIDDLEKRLVLLEKKKGFFG